ncbi:N-acetyl-gamma-glutamyl-phosphate reductase [Thermocrinis sp.]|uniref:N-acetyl-gamma-glutamyl-phosphate reductase n=1 Tax=Thermocrinis sp. TaxID=2024383 RepID=UPI002FDCA448
MEQEIKVAIYGATGYTGVELLNILLKHPRVKIVGLTSQSHVGKRLKEVFPFLEGPVGNLKITSDAEEEYDLAFLCLPHEESLELVPKLLNQGKKVIDLSGAYRIKNPQIYPEYYGFQHKYPKILERAVYGLPEIYRERIRNAQLVANPGCYPTSVLLALYPLIIERVKIEKVVITSLSGVSGAGRKPVQHFHFPEMYGDFFAYSLDKHRHVPEMESVIKEIGEVNILLRFSPVVVPTSRGMLSSLSIFCDKVEAKELYNETYKNEKFVRIVLEPPHVKHVLGTNLCLLYSFWDERVKCLQVISVIDNLGKGASSQAVQNFNIMFGFEEDLALNTVPSFP